MSMHVYVYKYIHVYVYVYKYIHIWYIYIYACIYLYISRTVVMLFYLHISIIEVTIGNGLCWVGMVGGVLWLESGLVWLVAKEYYLFYAYGWSSIRLELEMIPLWLWNKYLKTYYTCFILILPSWVSKEKSRR